MQKKVVGLTVALLLIIAGAMSAQELKFDGYINSGVGIVFSDEEDSDAFIKAFGVDSESNGYRFRLNGSYTNEAKNAGARFRLQSQRRLDRGSGGYFSLPYAYGWVGLADNVITLTGGIVMDSAWETVDWWVQDDMGEGLGLLIKAEPVKGLLFGFGAYTLSQQSGGSNNVLTANASGNYPLPNFGDIKPTLEDAKYTFNLSYTMPDTFRLGASLRLKNKAGGGAYSITDNTNPDFPGDYRYNGNEETTKAAVEFRYLGMKELTAVVVGTFDKLDEFEDTGDIVLSEAFAYKVSSEVSLGLNAVQFLYNRGSDTEMAPSLLFNLWGSYAIDNIVPRLDVVYFMNGRSTLVSAGTWHRKGFESVPYASDDENTLSVISLRPSVKINLDSKTFLEIGDMINIDSGTWDTAYGDSDTRMTNVFYVDMKWSF